jgi:hypothetical protein
MERQMNANWNQLLEDAIIGKVVTALVDEGFRLEMSDQDGGGLFVYAAEDGGEKPEGGYNLQLLGPPYARERRRRDR